VTPRPVRPERSKGRKGRTRSRAGRGRVYAGRAGLAPSRPPRAASTQGGPPGRRRLTGPETGARTDSPGPGEQGARPLASTSSTPGRAAGS